jgi:hypothetical protein
MDLKIIKEFCKNLNTDLLKDLSPEAKKLFIDGSYTCLFQKYGNIKIAEIVLQYYGEIEKVSNSWVSKTKDDNLTGFESLKRLGVVTIPVIDPRYIKDLRNKFMNTLRGFPEYKRNPENPDLDSFGNTLVYVLGGFAALGNPASFHNDLVRDLRQKCRKAVIPLFKELIDSYVDKKLRSETKLEMLFDRMMYRQISQQPVAESWHRDVIPPDRIQDNDELFGGWLNLDEGDQYFSCIPGSHLGKRQKDLDKGFATIPKDEVVIIGKYRHKFRVPSGHMIVFPQYILHEVVSQISKKNMMRVFTGWRTTISNDCLHLNTKEKIKMQAAMPLPSGQEPPMFSRMHESMYRRVQFRPISDNPQKVSTIEWSINSFLKELLKLDKSTNEYIIPRYLESLSHYKLPMYTPYTEEEISLYRPKKLD